MRDSSAPGPDLTDAPWQQDQLQGTEPDPAGPPPYTDARGNKWQDYPGGSRALYGSYHEF